MLSTGSFVLSIGIGIAIGVAFIAVYTLLSKRKSESLNRERESVLAEAKRRAEGIKKEAVIEAKDHVYQAKAEAEKEIKERRQELNHLERRLRQKEETLEKKFDQYERRENESMKKERDLNNRLSAAQDKEAQFGNILKEQQAVLEKMSGMNSSEAREELFRRVEEESRFESAKLAKRIEDETRETAEKKAREVVGASVQRYSSDYVSDATVSSVSLPNDEMKGRIIGREGRNIRALEAATGVDLIVDDTPETITLSAFDPVRRAVARLALEKLISDGRIHPSRIEEVVAKVQKEVDSVMREEGEAAVFDLGLSGVHTEIVKLLGRLKYRTSYGQNVLKHSREVAYLAGMMAGELGADTKLARRAGLLHDIGKSIDHEVEGSHQEIGGNFAKKHGESDLVVNAIKAHHGEGDPESVEAALVAAADALSAARPGVRSESIEKYIQRLEKLEELAMSHKGVEKCYAVQAGREVRIIVKPEEVSDEVSYTISKDLAKKIEEEMTYPGQIKVMVIRESRFVEYAR